MGRIQHYERPKTVEEAVWILAERKGKACVLAGGTSLALRQPPGVDTLVDLSRAGLVGMVDRGDSLAIKACTTVADLVSMPQAHQLFGGLLARASMAVASTPLRNQITVGGNLVQVMPWSDLPGVMLALNGQVAIQGQGQRIVPLREFYATHPRNSLSSDEIVTEVRIPKPIGRVQSSFVKVGKTAFDYAALTVTAVAWLSGNQVRECALSLGAIRPLPLRVPQAEEEIAGRIPTRDDVIRAAARAAGAVEPSQDYRYSKDYRRQLIKVWVKRCLHEALA
jgi:carbon-monoxide dehydrogenase medium subunit